VPSRLLSRMEGLLRTKGGRFSHLAPRRFKCRYASVPGKKEKCRFVLW
jgi:hypothetical protein